MHSPKFLFKIMSQELYLNLEILSENIFQVKKKKPHI